MPSHGKRSLRDAQLELTRELIMKATAEQARQDPLLDFSMQDVAAEAGMHLRSVYRHFPTRRALLEAFFEWVASQIDAGELIRSVRSLDDLPVLVREVYTRIAAMPEHLRRASALLGAMPLRSQMRQETEGIRDLFFAELPNLDPGELRHSFAVIRQMLSGRTVVPLTAVPDPDGGEALAWAVSTLIDDLKARDAAAARARG